MVTITTVSLPDPADDQLPSIGVQALWPSGVVIQDRACSSLASVQRTENTT